MEDFFSGAVPVIWTIAGTAVTTAVCVLYKKAHKFFDEHEKNNTVASEHEGLKAKVDSIEETLSSVQKGVKIVIKDLMKIEHKRLIEQRYATPDEKDHFDEMHSVYVENRGNGTGHAMHDDVMHMYSIAPADINPDERRKDD